MNVSSGPVEKIKLGSQSLVKSIIEASKLREHIIKLTIKCHNGRSATLETLEKASRRGRCETNKRCCYSSSLETASHHYNTCSVTAAASGTGLVGYFSIPKNDKPRFTVANSPYSEGQPLLYGMHVPLKFTVVL